MCITRPQYVNNKNVSGHCIQTNHEPITINLSLDVKIQSVISTNMWLSSLKNSRNKLLNIICPFHCWLFWLSLKNSRNKLLNIICPFHCWLFWLSPVTYIVWDPMSFPLTSVSNRYLWVMKDPKLTIKAAGHCQMNGDWLGGAQKYKHNCLWQNWSKF